MRHFLCWCFLAFHHNRLHKPSRQWISGWPCKLDIPLDLNIVRQNESELIAVSSLHFVWLSVVLWPQLIKRRSSEALCRQVQCDARVAAFVVRLCRSCVAKAVRCAYARQPSCWGTGKILQKQTESRCPFGDYLAHLSGWITHAMPSTLLIWGCQPRRSRSSSWW